MKTFIMVFLFMGLTNLMMAQNNIAVLTPTNELVYASKISNTDAKVNSDYLSTFTNYKFAAKIEAFQNAVANYDIKTAAVYQSKSNDTYTVDFKDSKNKVTAIYDKEGQLISCQENYKGIKLPYSIASKITTEHPNWSIKAVDCEIQYSNENQKSSVNYQVVIKSNKKTKTITIAL